jgi:hypothetical protein
VSSAKASAASVISAKRVRALIAVRRGDND